MLGKPCILSLFLNSFNKFIKHEHSCKIFLINTVNYSYTLTGKEQTPELSFISPSSLESCFIVLITPSSLMLKNVEQSPKNWTKTILACEFNPS